MKTSTLVLMVVAVAALAVFGTVTAVSAQGPIQNDNLTQGFGGRGGGMRGIGNQGEIENEEVHALMMDAYAEALGIPATEIDSRLEAGETFSQIALSTGLTFEEFWALKSQVKADVAAEALAQGFITQAEADLMQQAALRQGTRGGMRGSGFGTGAGAGVYCGAYAPAN
jgi:hypothetical protein